MTQQPHAHTTGAYYLVFGALLFLTGTTVGVSYLPLPEPWHTAAALVIAMVKALLVVLVFMHVYRAERLVQLIAASGLLWLLILIVYLYSDYLTRTWTERDLTSTTPTETALVESGR